MSSCLAPQTKPTLDVDDIYVVYNRILTAIEGVTLSVAPGQIVALLGPNGAGKTTTLRAVSGFLSSDHAHVSKGTISLGGNVITGLAPSSIARRGIALVPERDKVFTTLTVEDNLRVVAESGGETEKLVYDLFPILKKRKDQRAGYLSGGERQMLAIARALLLRPSIMLIDEMSFGLAPALAQRLLATVAQVSREQQVGILVVEQNAAAALAVADHAYIMERGRIVLSGSCAELDAHSAVRTFYLGLGDGADGGYLSARQTAERKWS
jgi:branched-chain amino acid transport system ATP-binding protein